MDAVTKRKVEILKKNGFERKSAFLLKTAKKLNTKLITGKDTWR